ncbi:MAG: L-seryl-tRNA(Sec) selenium transferase [Planctomycetaceae bacterium]|nr:L-seryl-tRNA(Sec) selenium transferase [Planctomycetaceae bacterium]
MRQRDSSEFIGNTESADQALTARFAGLRFSRGFGRLRPAEFLQNSVSINSSVCGGNQSVVRSEHCVFVVAVVFIPADESHLMSIDPRQLLPSVSLLLDDETVRALVQRYGRPMVRTQLQRSLECVRQSFASDARQNNTDLDNGALRTTLRLRVLEDLQTRLLRQNSERPRRVINATGVLLHTGLGRAPLSATAVEAITDAAGACLLEVDPHSTERRYRGFQVGEMLHLLTGAESSLIVNNNAAATLLVLCALCSGREVILSRGQLVEIGGSFRLPEIFQQAGAVLREVGTTNRTHLKDYADAINENTAAIMRVHASNYRIVGFSTEPDTHALAQLAHEHDLLMIDDIGSGLLTKNAMFPLNDEPDFESAIAAGADVVLGSGDKLMGGPQSGIIVGHQSVMTQLRHHPLARCVRIDKLNLAALHATLLQHCTDAAADAIPLLQMLKADLTDLQSRAQQLVDTLNAVDDITCSVRPADAQVGGGSCADRFLPSIAVVIDSQRHRPDSLAMQLRLATPSIWGRVQDGGFWLDLRSVQLADDAELAQTLLQVLQSGGE